MPKWPYLKQYGLNIQSNVIALVSSYKEKAHLICSKSFMPSGAALGEWKWPQLTLHLHEIVRQYRLHGIRVVIPIDSRQTHMGDLYLPRGLSRREIVHEINEQLQRDNFNPDKKYIIDFFIIKSAPVQKIFYVAGDAEYIKQYVCSVNQSGFIVKSIDLDVFALKRGASVMLNKKFNPCDMRETVPPIDCTTLFQEQCGPSQAALLAYGLALH